MEVDAPVHAGSEAQGLRLPRRAVVTRLAKVQGQRVPVLVRIDAAQGQTHPRAEGEKVTHVFWWRKYRPEWKGRLCRVVARGKLNSVMIEFEDGTGAVTSRYAVRRIRSNP